MSLNESSAKYIIRCVETIMADKNISEQTLLVMFMQYSEKVLKEKEIENES